MYILIVNESTLCTLLSLWAAVADGLLWHITIYQVLLCTSRISLNQREEKQDIQIYSDLSLPKMLAGLSLWTSAYYDHLPPTCFWETKFSNSLTLLLRLSMSELGLISVNVVGSDLAKICFPSGSR